ncbi:hypothetical protein [Streptomyces sp. WMMB303]|uniref:hypothetical protein n=1 Tax=Streptomyces sp. WMMB303 TaxID=3034154 RepID=UPI0023EB76D6|nr:hypothetical protein [Streptomyces sp. WMMB303]MDF4254557.1 hypothetical protein [Streptomyces sp. WMMB303]
MSAEDASAAQPCGCNNGKVMVTVNHCGADGEPYQSVEWQTCPNCQGSGRR